MKIEDVRYPAQMRYGTRPYQNAFATPYGDFADDLTRYARLAAEFGYGDEAEKLTAEALSALRDVKEKFNALLENPAPDPAEPEDLASIRALRPEGPRRIARALPADYRRRFMGSILGRGAGCTLGAALEFSSVEESADWARYCGQAYPLDDYWKMVKNPNRPRYKVGRSNELARGQMDCIPADDDTGYTLIGLLLLEKYGPDFTQEDLAQLWKDEFLPLQSGNGSWGCFWGERNLLINLLDGMPVEKAGYHMNPNVQSVAAWTRADSWGYVAPGWPEKAAALAYKDASVNHRRSGVYGEMFFAAAIAAAFVVDDPVEAIKIGLTEIPKDCMFASAVNWALSIAPTIRNYKDAADAVHTKYDGMFGGHAIVNALFVVFGILIGGRDFTKVIGETVAMTFDNDCTGATAGSIVGAVVGKDGIDAHWYQNFDNRMRCYFNSTPEYIGLDELFSRYEKQARALRGI